mgnify:FL=1
MQVWPDEHPHGQVRAVSQGSDSEGGEVSRDYEHELLRALRRENKKDRRLRRVERVEVAIPDRRMDAPKLEREPGRIQCR